MRSSTPAVDEPALAVSRFLYAIKENDQRRAYLEAGVDLARNPFPTVDELVRSSYFTWRLHRFRVKSVHRSGSEAVVVVEETVTRTLPESVRRWLAIEMPTFGAALHLGNVTLTESFSVLQNDGAWTLDPQNAHDAVEPFLQMLRAFYAKGSDVPRAVQSQIARAVNAVGIGHMVLALPTFPEASEVTLAIRPPRRGLEIVTKRMPDIVYLRADFGLLMAQAQYAQCERNLRLIGRALKQQEKRMWALPNRLSDLVPDDITHIPTCPVAGTDTYTSSYQNTATDFTVSCGGHHHASALMGPDMPQYSSLMKEPTPSPSPSGAPSAAPTEPSETTERKAAPTRRTP